MTAPTSRLTTALRLQTVMLRSVLLQIVGILGGIFAVQLFVYIVIKSAADENTFEINGVVPGFLGVFLLVLMALNVSQTMPFALSLGLTRRDFYLSSVIYFAGLIVAVMIAVGALSAVEHLTDGWGIGFTFFRGVEALPIPAVSAWVFQVVAIFAFTMVAAFFGSVYVRWNQLGMWTASIGIALVAAVAVAIVTWFGWWGAVGEFFVETPLAVLLIGIPAVIAAAAGTGGWLVLRRAAV